MNVGGSHVNDHFGCLSKFLTVGRPKKLAEMIEVLGGEMVENPRTSVSPTFLNPTLRAHLKMLCAVYLAKIRFPI